MMEFFQDPVSFEKALMVPRAAEAQESACEIPFPLSRLGDIITVPPRISI